MNKLIVGVVIIVLIALGAYWILNREPAEPETLVTEEDALLLRDQQPGEQAVVTYAKLSTSGYVAVYGTDETETKTLLGTSDLLAAGEHRNVIVRYRGGSTRAGAVSATIIADDGDGVFSAETDTQTLTAEQEAELSEDVELQLNPSEEFLAEMLQDAGYAITIEIENETSLFEDMGAMMEGEATTEEEASTQTATEEDDSMMEGETGSADASVEAEAEVQ